MRPCIASRLATVLFLLTAFLGVPRPIIAGDSIDQMLATEAPKLLQKLRQGEFDSVAVLPFRLRYPESGVSLKGAVIQTNFAAKLERALATFYDRRQPVRVVFDAWNQALEQDQQANFTSLEGRKKLFQQRFKLPVDSPLIPVDAFITGIIEPSDDYRTTTVSFELCTRDSPDKLKRSDPPVVIQTDRNVLVSMGRGFSVPQRRLATRWLTTNDIMDGVTEDAQWVKEQDKKNGITDPRDRVNVAFERPLDNFPIAFKILYDNQPQTIRLDTTGGQFNGTVQDPAESQRVTFELENVRNEVLAVILSVNGQNTLYGGDATDLSSAAMWVLQPGRTYAVRGVYGKDRKTMVPLRGLSDADSETILRDGYVNPELAGLIALHVFREAPTPVDTEQQITSDSDTEHDAHVAGKLDPVHNTSSDDQATTTAQQDFGISIGGGASELTGFNLGLVRGLKARGSFHPREDASMAPSWSKLQDKLFMKATGAGASRGLMIASGPEEQVEVKTREMGQTEMIASAVIRYLSVARPDLPPADRAATE